MCTFYNNTVKAETFSRVSKISVDTMACFNKRGYLGTLVLFGALAVAFHGFAFVAPGWIMLERDVTKRECQLLEKTEITEEVGEIGLPPQTSDRPVAMADTDESMGQTGQEAEEVHGEIEEFRAWIVRSVVSQRQILVPRE